MKLYLSLLVTAAILTLASNAQALTVPADTIGYDAIAAAHWGAEPCNGQVDIRWDHLGPATNAHATWFGVPGDATTYTDCSITYSLDVPWDPAKLCTVDEHEHGHLMGHDHDDSVLMNAYYVGPTPECQQQTAVSQSPPVVKKPHRMKRRPGFARRWRRRGERSLQAYTLGIADTAPPNAAISRTLHATVYRLVLDPAQPLDTYDARIAAFRAAGQEPQLVIGGTGTPNHASTDGVVAYAVAAAQRWPFAYSISVINEPNEAGVGVCEYARTYLAAYRALRPLGIRRILFGEWSPAPDAFAWHSATLKRCGDTSRQLRPIVKHIAWHGYWNAINWGPAFRAIHRSVHAVAPLLHVTEAGAVLRLGQNINIENPMQADLAGMRYWRMALRAAVRDKLSEVCVWELHSPAIKGTWDSGLISPEGRERPAFRMIADRLGV